MGRRFESIVSNASVHRSEDAGAMHEMDADVCVQLGNVTFDLNEADETAVAAVATF